MPPRPFPYPLSIGTDIASLQRIRLLLTRNEEEVASDSRLARYLRHFLTHREQVHFWERFPNVKPTTADQLRESDDVVRYLAGRYVRVSRFNFSIFFSCFSSSLFGGQVGGERGCHQGCTLASSLVQTRANPTAAGVRSAVFPDPLQSGLLARSQGKTPCMGRWSSE